MNRLSLTLLGALILSACAQPASSQAGAGKSAAPAAGKADASAAAAAGKIPAAGTPEARARAVIRSFNPNVKMDRVGPAPFPGYQEVIVEGQVLYVSDDGKYMMQGTVLDVASKKNLTEVSLARLRNDVLKGIPVSDRIVFGPADAKHRVVVLTDIECGYCRKMHSEIAEINKRGIAVEYLAFPRGGIGSEDYKTMVSVWCSADRRKALTDAKNGKPVPPRNCPSPVMAHYQAGLKMGLEGTPMVLAPDGTSLGGYLPPDMLLERITKWEVESKRGSDS